MYEDDCPFIVSCLCHVRPVDISSLVLCYAVIFVLLNIGMLTIVTRPLS